MERTSHAPAGQSQAGVRAGSVTGRRVQANGTTIVDTLSHAATLRGLQADVGDSR